MDQLLSDMVKAIVDKPEEVKVEIEETESVQIYKLSVGEGDLGKVIGKKGKNVGALRVIMTASNAKEGGKRAILEVIE
tara:strand:- start:217 stop:450 length:234 start_codon:yes stop_codon:yes gene_type:complete